MDVAHAIGGVIILCVFSFAFGILFGEFRDREKSECESTLPRNIECIWSKPEGFEE